MANRSVSAEPRRSAGTPPGTHAADGGVEFAGYRLRELIRSVPGSGEIYRAVDVGSGTVAYVALLPTNISADREQVDRVGTRAMAVCADAYPGVLRVVRFGAIGGRAWFAVEPAADGTDSAALAVAASTVVDVVAGATNPRREAPPSPVDPEPLALPRRFNTLPGGVAITDIPPELLHTVERPPDTQVQRKPRGKRVLVVAGVSGGLALAIGLGLLSQFRNEEATNSASATPVYHAPPRPDGCVDGVPSTQPSRRGMNLGAMSVPRRSLPADWKSVPSVLPYVTRAQLVGTSTVPDQAWRSEVGIGLLPKSVGRTPRAAGQAFLDCLVHSPRYAGTEPQAPVVTDVSEGVSKNGVRYAQIAARVSTGKSPDGVSGDAVYLMIAKTSPMTVAVGIAPLEDQKVQEQVRRTLGAVQVRTPSRH